MLSGKTAESDGVLGARYDHVEAEPMWEMSADDGGGKIASRNSPKRRLRLPRAVVVASRDDEGWRRRGRAAVRRKGGGRAWMGAEKKITTLPKHGRLYIRLPCNFISLLISA